jgi:hypothetical protein
VEGVNSRMILLIHCKNLCKYYNVPPTQHNNNNNFKNKERKNDRFSGARKCVRTRTMERGYAHRNGLLEGFRMSIS